MLKDNGIYLEVKRGMKKPRNFKPKYSIRNDVIAQIILSIIGQILIYHRYILNRERTQEKMSHSRSGQYYEKHNTGNFCSDRNNIQAAK